MRRKKYQDPSGRFRAWVNDLSIEKSFFGRWLDYSNKRFSLKKWGALFMFSLGLAALVVIDLNIPYDLELNETARRDYRSPFSFELIDGAATEKKREEAANSQPPFFDYAISINSEIHEKFKEAMRHMRIVSFGMKGRGASEIEKHLTSQRGEFESILGRPVPTEVYQWLVKDKFSVDTERLVGQLLDYWGGEKLISGLNDQVHKDQRFLAVRDIQYPDNRIMTLSRFRVKDLMVSEDFNHSGFEGYDALSRKSRDHVDKLVRHLLLPNLTLNKSETELRKKQAMDSVLPVAMSIKKNRPFLREGQTVQPIHLQVVREIQAIKAQKRHFLSAFAAALLFSGLVMVSYAFLRRFTFKRVALDSKSLFVMACITLFTTLVAKLFFFLTDATFVHSMGEQVPATFFTYMTPVALGAMLVGLLVTSGELVWLYILFQSLVLSFMVDNSFTFFTITLLGSATAARAVFGCKSRTDIYKAGVLVGVVQALAITCFHFFLSNGAGHSELYWLVPAGLFSGILSSLLTMTFIPLAENLFNVTTDVKLLELSNLNHPLMKQMVVKAPGTYHHCLIVGALCEAAGEEIGANPLLAKVMAYYHDIGKMDHAQYFIENQRPDYNPHDHISPYMSKTILVAHVKDGAEMGMKYNLGTPIIDGILQHHGTTLMPYFYNKALENQDEDVDVVKEEDFRYPGPKPQFKEAALVMLADSVEAAARAIDEPTTARLQNLVKTIIHRKFADGQLDECNLTFRELTIIERCFNRILIGVYHHRIDYPSAPTKENPPVRIATPRSGRGPVTA